MNDAGALLGALAEQGLTCPGEPSAVIPVLMGPEDVSRLASALTFERGVVVGQSFFCVAASQWGSFDDGGAIWPDDRLVPAAGAGAPSNVTASAHG